MHLHWIDLLIVLVYVGGTIAAGILARSSIKGISDFLVAGRALKTHMAVATMVSTGLGLVTVMYFAQEGFVNGFSPFLIGVIATIAHIIIGKTGFLVSRLRHTQVMTVPELYEVKYSRGVRLLGGSILGLAGTLNMCLFPILGSKFVVGFTGMDPSWVNPVMIVLLIIVVFYTLMGGMVSVVLTDFAQFVLLTIGFLLGTYFILTHPALGWDTIVNSLDQHKGADAFDPISNASYGWIFVVYFISISFVSILWQPEMSRPLSTENSEVARKVFWIQGLTSVGRAIIPMFWGAAAFAWTHLPSYTGAYANDGQSAVPEMLGQILPIGVAGLLLAGMFAAFMSTHDSYLLAWSGVFVRDVVSPIKAMMDGAPEKRGADDTWGGLSSEREIYWTRFFVIVLATLLAGFGMFFIDRLPETAFKWMYLTGTIYFAGTVGTVVLGLYWSKANRIGAYCALILGGMGPINFLIMSMVPEVVPGFMQGFVENSNLTVMASLIMGALGMIVGSLLTQKSNPPRALDFKDMK
ncbi:MAG: sodium:solute symporter family protein [Gemmatimonadetes bacterium]|jgi:solute:Na+ symporter, SSS family|nr:sodium:solute symporter family protein [Gemmatimonadota bacterium]MBT7860813.1 sodium:solute symporter family protein [Gemmatimonadota bacterium]